jgi:uncharacterized membrane protein
MGNRSWVLPLFLLILATGVMLRFYNYADWSLSNDELSAMARLQFPDFPTMIREGVMLNDMHPPGVQVFLWYWTHFFGTTQWLYRLPFVIAGCLSVWVFFLIGRKWFGDTAALVSTAVFAGCSFLVLYSQLARPYSPGLFTSLLFVLAITELLISDKIGKKTGWWVLLTLSGAACMYIHYFCFMFAGIAGLGALMFVRSRKELFHFVFAGVIMFILFIPAFPVAWHQFSIGGLGGPDGWLGPPKRDAIFQFVLYAFNRSYPLLIFMLALFIAGLKNLKDYRFKLRIYALILAVLPVLIAYYYSIWKNPVFQYSILIFGFPFLILFLVSGLKVVQPKLQISLSLLALLFSASTMIFGQQFYSTAQFAVFKEIAQKTEDYRNKYGVDNILLTVNVISPFYIHYYLDEIAPGMKYDLYDRRDAQSLRSLDSLAGHSAKDYFLHAWSNVWHGAETEQIIRAYFPYRVERDSFFNAGIVVYSKKTAANQMAPLLDTLNTFEYDLWNNDAMLRDSSMSAEGKFSMKLRPETEFSSGIDIRLGDYNVQKGNMVECDVLIQSAGLNKEAMIVMSLDRDGKSLTWRSRTLSDFVIPGSGWKRVYYAYRFIEDIHPDDRLKIYIWNPGKNTFYADNMRIRIW